MPAGAWRRVVCMVLCSGPLACREVADPARARLPQPSTRERVPELRLLRALPIQVEGRFEPSGLLLREGHLLTVSDKHDGAIFELELGTTEARVRPFLEFVPPADEPAPLDYEGLAADTDGALLLVSESRFRVLRVQPGAPGPGTATRSAHAQWLTPSLQAMGQAVGCFGVPNANLEGITRLPGAGLLLAAERDPRGLLELAPDGALASARAWAMPDAAFALPEGRDPDFADLTLAGAEVYALVRNAHVVVKLTRTPEAWIEGRAFSYAAVENDPRWAYQSRTYGLAEGLAIGEHQVFVVLDTNGQARAEDARDRRPLLLVFERPADW
jgi:hypothetical protein